MEYSKSFCDLVNSFFKEKNDENLKFIGTGNPSAKILIIGKEAALSEKNLSIDFNFHYGLHQDNTSLWAKCIDQNQDFDDIKVWGRNCKKYIREDFSPLYPYKHDQKLHRLPQNGGTSKTWKCYQKLISLVYPGILSEEEVDFHKYAFISELSSKPFPKSPAKNKATENSIRIRTTELFTHDFFQQFPVIIVAAGIYVSKRMYDIDLQALFNLTYVNEDPSEKDPSEWIRIYKSGNRLLLHCKQLSRCSNDLLIRLANIIREHINL